MSATFFDPAHSGERIPPTTDLESTTDLQGHTTDLAPATKDIEPAAVRSERPSEIGAAHRLQSFEDGFPGDGHR